MLQILQIFDPMKQRTTQRMGRMPEVKQQANTLGTLRRKKISKVKQGMEQQQSIIQDLGVKNMHKLLLRARGIANPPIRYSQIKQAIEIIVNRQRQLTNNYSQIIKLIQLTTQTVIQLGEVQLQQKWLNYLTVIGRKLYKYLEDNFCLQSCINCARVCSCLMRCVNVGTHGVDEQAGEMTIKVVQIIRCNFPSKHMRQTSENDIKHILKTILQLIQYESNKLFQVEDDSEMNNHILDLSRIYIHYLPNTLSIHMLQLLGAITHISIVKQEVVSMIWSSVLAHLPVAQKQCEILTIIMCQHPPQHNNMEVVRKWVSIYWHQLSTNQTNVLSAMHGTLSAYINHHTAATILFTLTWQQSAGEMDNTYMKKTINWLIGQASEWGWEPTLLCIRHILNLVMLCVECFWSNGEGQEWLGSDCSHMAALLLLIQHQITSKVYFGNQHTNHYISGRRYLSVRLLTKLYRGLVGICKDDTLVVLQYKSLKWMVQLLTTSQFSGNAQLAGTCLLLMVQLVYGLASSPNAHSYSQQIQHMLVCLSQFKINNQQTPDNIQECCKHLLWMHCHPVFNKISHAIGSILFGGSLLPYDSQTHPFTCTANLIHILYFSNLHLTKEHILLLRQGFGQIGVQINQLRLIVGLLAGIKINQYEIDSVEISWVKGLLWMLGSEAHNTTKLLKTSEVVQEAWDNFRYVKLDRGAEQNTININTITADLIKQVLRQALLYFQMPALIVISYYVLYELITTVSNDPSQADGLLESIYNLQTKLIKQTCYQSNSKLGNKWKPLVLLITQPLQSALSTVLQNSMHFNQGLRKLFNCIINCFAQSNGSSGNLLWANQAEEIHKRANKIISHYLSENQLQFGELKYNKIRVLKVGGKARVIRKTIQQTQTNQ